MPSYPATSTKWLTTLVSLNAVSSSSNVPLLDYTDGYLKIFDIPAIIADPGGNRGHVASEYTEVRVLEQIYNFTKELVVWVTGEEVDLQL
ncbi:hypothetical protein ABL78_5247 [Leptomonas seymouri]|uniref:Uncharacterized protein n=1 Tax=Leptomonas seymouri TaxID=5684 RepID=A0A0N1I3R8_LEPSE|nr:hypothetical protein ABL78_5247 [Leptomonas seymouri]|eukprot:KPI85715.1 hypothetical protein ABL78_5247 [Leptomonas seymouri]